jgi:hypothetical protein
LVLIQEGWLAWIGLLQKLWPERHASKREKEQRGERKRSKSRVSEIFRRRKLWTDRWLLLSTPTTADTLAYSFSKIRKSLTKFIEGLPSNQPVRSFLHTCSPINQ